MKSGSALGRLEFIDGSNIPMYGVSLQIIQTTLTVSLKCNSFVEGDEKPIFIIVLENGAFKISPLNDYILHIQNNDGTSLGHRTLVSVDGEGISDGFGLFHFVFGQSLKLAKGISEIRTHSIFFPKKRKFLAQPATLKHRIVTDNWYFEEREHLKKSMLTYGYGRWDKIMECSKGSNSQYSQTLSVGLEKKPLELIKAFGNAFVRSISENLSLEMKHLEPVLLNIIQEEPSDPFVQINAKAWDMNLIRHRANLWGKRIAFLHKIKIFKGHYAKFYKKRFGRKPKNPSEYHYLLNMLPSTLLLGQRPATWWDRTHDIDLIIGSYKYGYANYNQMKDSGEFGFNIMEKCCYHNEFPNADTITRRLKKLVGLIERHEETFRKFNFESRDPISQDIKEFTKDELKDLFKVISDSGVPVSSDGKSNWVELRDRFYTSNKIYESKSVGSLERLVHYFRFRVQKLIKESASNEFAESLQLERKLEQEEFPLSLEEAELYFKNNDQLRYIRKVILFNSEALFNANTAKLAQSVSTLKEDNPAKISDQSYKPDWHDKNILKLISEKGYNALKDISSYKNFGFEGVNLSSDKLRARVNFICMLFKSIDSDSMLKKRVSDKGVLGDPKKKIKKQIKRDENGNIIFPISVSSSLKFLAQGMSSMTFRGDKTGSELSFRAQPISSWLQE